MPSTHPRITDPRVTATPAARRALAALRTAGSGVMFVQSAGCCDGSDPMCFAAGEFATGDSDLLLGEVDGCPFYVNDEIYHRLGRPRLLLDVAAGPPGGFSLAAGDDLHFITRTAPVPGDPTPGKDGRS